MPFTLKRGATRPTFQIQLFDDYGTANQRPIDISNTSGITSITAVMSINIRNDGGAIISRRVLRKPARRMYPTSKSTDSDFATKGGWVEYIWDSVDTAIVGDISIEFDLSWGGEIETVPNSGYFTATIERDLDGSALDDSDDYWNATDTLASALRPFERITVSGHSIALGAGAKVAAADQRLAALLSTPPSTPAGPSAGYRGIRNNAQGSSIAILDDQNNGANYGGWARRLANIVSNATLNPSVGSLAGYGFDVPDTTADIIWWGLNDLGILGYSARVLRCFENTIRAMVHWGRANCIFLDNNAAVVSRNASNAVITPTAFNGCNSGTTLTGMSNNSYTTLTLPAEYPGGFVTVLYAGYQGLSGPTITAKVDGTTVATRVVEDPLDYPPLDVRTSFGLIPVRVPIPADANPHTIRMDVTNGAIFLDSFIVEATYPPLTLLPLLNMPYNPAFWLKPITAPGLAAFNNILNTIAAEFDDIRTADLDPVLAGMNGLPNPANFIADGAHPNDTGYARIAALFAGIAADWSMSRTAARKALSL